MNRVHSLLLKALEGGELEKTEKNKPIPKYIELKNPVNSKTKDTSSKRGSQHGGLQKCSYCNNYGHNRTICKRRRINNRENYLNEESFVKEDYGDINIAEEDLTVIPISSHQEDKVGQQVKTENGSTFN